MRCNWSVDYYLSCACQIKIIKMQGGRDREWNVSGLLHCGRVVHAFPLLETERNLTILLRRTLCHLENWIPLHLPPKLHCGWVYDRPGHVPLIQREAEAWVLGDGKVLEDMGVTESWLTAVTALRCQKWALQESNLNEQFKDTKKLGNMMTDSANGHLYSLGTCRQKTSNINVKRVSDN